MKLVFLLPRIAIVIYEMIFLRSQLDEWLANKVPYRCLSHSLIVQEAYATY